MTTRTWSDLSRTQQWAIGIGSMVQVAAAAAAWVDLARRPAALVAGRKSFWAAIIAVNFVGPAAYALRGRRAR